MIRVTHNLHTGKLEIRFPYDERIALILKLKFHSDWRFVKENFRAWEINLREGADTADRLRAFLEEAGGEADVAESVWIACEVADNWRAENLKLSGAVEFEAPCWQTVFGGDLTPLQRASGEYMHRNARGVILGDDPSYNPGVTMLGVLEVSQDYPVLVLTREADKLAWLIAFRKYTRRRGWVLGDELAAVHMLKNDEAVQMAICNFGSMIGWLPWIVTIDWKAIVIDQAHYIRNGDSDQAQVLKDLTRDTRQHKYMLSQSDFLAHPWEAAAQLEVLGRMADLGGRVNFMGEYTQHKNGLLAPRNIEELDTALRSVCYVGHKKEAENG